MSFFIDSITNLLDPEPQLKEPHGHAAVTLILKKERTEYNLLMIERADNPKDPWSGQMAFPGGRHEKQDRTILDTAYRETVEEVGMDLRIDGQFLGCLPDLQARNRHGLQKFKIVPHLFLLENEVDFNCQPQEVKQAHWVSFSHLVKPENHKLIQYPFDSKPLNLPSILFKNKPIWGLSYTMLTDLVCRLFDGKILDGLIEGTVSSIDFWREHPS